VIDADPPALRQMIDVFERGGRAGARRRARAEGRDVSLRRHRRGGDPATASTGSATWWRSRRARRPLDLAIIGRYILTPDIFPALEATAVGPHRRDPADQRPAAAAQDRPIYACEIDGVRHDTGNKLGFLKAVVYFALRRPDLAGPSPSWNT
jgi:UTP--glucose-1-phosphate uridylyltransferase